MPRGWHRPGPVFAAVVAVVALAAGCGHRVDVLERGTRPFDESFKIISGSSMLRECENPVNPGKCWSVPLRMAVRGQRVASSEFLGTESQAPREQESFCVWYQLNRNNQPLDRRLYRLRSAGAEAALPFTAVQAVENVPAPVAQANMRTPDCSETCEVNSGRACRLNGTGVVDVELLLEGELARDGQQFELLIAPARREEPGRRPLSGDMPSSDLGGEVTREQFQIKSDAWWFSLALGFALALGYIALGAL